MSAMAIVLLVLSIVVVWGGLLASVIFLHRHPLDPNVQDVAPEDVGFHEL